MVILFDEKSIEFEHAHTHILRHKHPNKHVRAHTGTHALTRAQIHTHTHTSTSTETERERGRGKETYTHTQTPRTCSHTLTRMQARALAHACAHFQQAEAKLPPRSGLHHHFVMSSPIPLARTEANLTAGKCSSIVWIIKLHSKVGTAQLPQATLSKFGISHAGLSEVERTPAFRCSGDKDSMPEIMKDSEDSNPEHRTTFPKEEVPQSADTCEPSSRCSTAKPTTGTLSPPDWKCAYPILHVFAVLDISMLLFLRCYPSRHLRASVLGMISLCGLPAFYPHPLKLVFTSRDPCNWGFLLGPSKDGLQKERNVVIVRAILDL